MAGQKIFRSNTAQTEGFANLFLRQAVFPVPFRCDRLERETLRIGVSGTRQSLGDIIRDFERQNHVFAYGAPGSAAHGCLVFKDTRMPVSTDSEPRIRGEHCFVR